MLNFLYYLYSVCVCFFLALSKTIKVKHPVTVELAENIGARIGNNRIAQRREKNWRSAYAYRYTRDLNRDGGHIMKTSTKERNTRMNMA